jgi:nitrous-oxide reductase
MSAAVSQSRQAFAVAALLAALAGIAGCGKGSSPAVASSDAASKTYVAPGKYDDFYAFLSGGFSGQVSVYGLPPAGCSG